MAKPVPVLAIMLLGAVNLGHATGIYKWIDENGTTHFGDTPPVEANYSVPKIRIDTDTPDPGVPETTTAEVDNRVVMYSTRWCTHCQSAKAYFKQKRIRFVEYDIETSPAARRRYDKLGGRGVPLIVVGDQQMTGFNPASFDQLYSQR